MRPASPIVNAVPPGRWPARKSAVARAEVQIASSGTSQPDRSQARSEVAARVHRVVGQDEEGQTLLAQPLEEAVCARNRALLAHEHAVHVHEP